MSFLKYAEGEVIENNIPAEKALANIEITERFVKLAATLRKIAPRSNEFLYFTTIMLHSAEASLVDPKTGELKNDKNGKPLTGGFDKNWRWHCSDPTIQPYANQNGDIFPEAELKSAYKKWNSRPLCINHMSNDVEGIRGIILDTYYDEKFKRVIGLCALDKISYSDLAYKVKTGYANSVSMGTAVSKALCTVCLKAAVTPDDYCDCIRNKKGQIINGVKVGEINLGLNPIELSLVVTPADPQAKVLKIIASMNNYVDQRNTLLEKKDQATAEKLANLDGSIKTVENQLNRLFSECTDNSCQFTRTQDGHIKLIKSAQPHIDTWQDFFQVAHSIDDANDYDKHNLFDKLNNMLRVLKTEDLRNNTTYLTELAEVMGSKNKYLRETILQPILEQLKSTVRDSGSSPSLEETQFTSPDGADKDLNLDSGSTVSMPPNEQETGARVSKQVNPSETGVKSETGSNFGPSLGSPSDRFEFGNFASFNNQVKVADIEQNLNLLLRQTQEIEAEVCKMKEKLLDTTTNSLNNNMANEKAATLEDIKMNEARLKLRAAQRQALLNKLAAEDMCEKCEMKKDECKCEAEKKAYWQGTEQPKPGQVQYKPDFGGEPKIRMNDKHMKQDKSMGGNEGAFPGDEAEKEKLLRAELQDRALKRRAYWLGTEEPTPGKAQYKKDPLNEKDRSEDKHMKQDKSMGGNKGVFPGDEAEKKKLLRAELAPGVLRTKFTKVRNNDGTYNKQASYFEIFAGDQKLLTATAEEIYGDELNKQLEGTDKTAWEMLSSQEYGKEIISAIRSEGFEKVAYLLKGAQAAPAAPEMPAGLEAGNLGAAPEAMPEAPKADKKVELDETELMNLVNTMEETLTRLKTEITGEDDDKVKDMAVKTEDEGVNDEAEKLGNELTASINTLGREVYAELDQSADEIALLYNYFEKAASLSDTKKAEVNELAQEAVSEGKALLEEANTILAVAAKVKKDEDKAEKDDKEEMKDEKKDKKTKKDDKATKKPAKGKGKDKKDKKKSKKAELASALLKLANELDYDDEDDYDDDEDEDFGHHDDELAPDEKSDYEATSQDDDLDKEMKDLGLLADNASDNCALCGHEMNAEHNCTASAKDQLVREALLARKLKREALLKAAEEKKYDVLPDDHGMVNEAHKGSEANPATKLDVKPQGDGAVIENIDKVHDAMMEAANSTPTGKQGSAELEIKAELEAGVKEKKAEEDKNRYRIKLRRAYDLGLQMQLKGMIANTKEALDKQVDEVMKFSDEAFESYKRAVANTKAVVKTASVSNKPALQVGVREDNSVPSENDAPLAEQLKKLWK